MMAGTFHRLTPHSSRRLGCDLTRGSFGSAIVLYYWVRNVIGYDSHALPPDWMDHPGQYSGEIGIEFLRIVGQACFSFAITPLSAKPQHPLLRSRLEEA